MQNGCQIFESKKYKVAIRMVEDVDVDSTRLELDRHIPSIIIVVTTAQLILSKHTAYAPLCTLLFFHLPRPWWCGHPTLDRKCVTFSCYMYVLTTSMEVACWSWRSQWCMWWLGGHSKCLTYGIRRKIRDKDRSGCLSVGMGDFCRERGITTHAVQWVYSWLTNSLNKGGLLSC